MPSARSTGIVIANGRPELLKFAVQAYPGKGKCYYSGAVVPQFFGVQATILEAIQHQFPELDITLAEFSIDHSMPSGFPLAGTSFGLALGIAMVAAILRDRVNTNFIYTGELTNKGKVLPVGAIDKKRRSASYHKADKFILPDSQVDIGCSFIDQIPVITLRDAYDRTVTKVFHDHT